MEDISIEGWKGVYIVPTVNFSSATGECEIIGESFLEETYKFYSPLVDWIKRYIETHNSIKFTFKLSYFNTSTSKWILTIFSELRKFELAGGKVDVIWYYYEDDIDMRDDILDYMNDTGLTITLSPII
mgnify:CR=1 FL=1